MKSQLIWASVSPEIPWLNWWPELRTAYKWPDQITAEKFECNEHSWAQILDSVRSFNLFSKQKVVVVLNADKTLNKKNKEAESIIEKLSQAPHSVVLQTEAAAPKSWEFESWTAEALETIPAIDDKAVFRWVDAIHSQNIKLALRELEKASAQGVHPLVFVQLLTRHFRMGRLIAHAQEKRLSESEILKCLKVPAFVLQKWKRQTKVSKAQWTRLFERLYRADLELKSGTNEDWCLRKLTYDLVERPTKIRDNKQNSFVMKPASLFEQSLWKVATSFS